MTIERVDFPSYKMVIFHSYVTVYQRVMFEERYLYNLLVVLSISHGFYHLVGHGRPVYI